jgi:hypothetical protein
MSTTQKPDPATVGGRESPDTGPFAGMANADGEPIADTNADPDAQFRVVYIGPDAKTITVGTSDLLEQAEELFAMTAPGKGRVFLFEAGDDAHPLDSKGEIEPRRTSEEQTEPERTIDTEPEETEEPEVEEPAEPGEEAHARIGWDRSETGLPEAADRAEGGKLFEPGDFDDPALFLETPDGDRIDEIIVKVSGSLVLNRKDPLHVELFRELDRGRSVVVEAGAHIVQESLDEKTKGEETILSAARKLVVWRIESVRVAGRKIELPSIAARRSG